MKELVIAIVLEACKDLQGQTLEDAFNFLAKDALRDSDKLDVVKAFHRVHVYTLMKHFQEKYSAT